MALWNSKGKHVSPNQADGTPQTPAAAGTAQGAAEEDAADGNAGAKKRKKAKKPKGKHEGVTYDVGDRRMKASIISILSGNEELENVQVVRVQSVDYSLFIMPDYTPVIGEVKGTVKIVTDTEMVTADNIWGFYVLKDNHFQLMIREKLQQQEPAAESAPAGAPQSDTENTPESSS